MAADGTTAPAIDLAAIATPEGLAAALDELRRQLGIASKRAISTRADNLGVALPKSTVDDLLRGRRVPTEETLRAFLTVCGVTDQAQVQAWERAAERARRGDTDRPPGAVRVQAANPRLLGVHAAIQVPGATGDLSAYIPRDLDQEDPTGVRVRLRSAAILGGFVLLVGGSSVGKTRCAYEALQTLLPDWWLVHPDPDQPATLAALGADPPPRTVIWLDELQTYLDREQGLTAATVRALLHAPAPVVLVGTLWPHWYATWTTPPSPGQPDVHRRQRDVLGLAEVFHVPDEFSIAEHDRAIQLAATDARLLAALDVKDFGLTQTLAAAPQLVDRWESAGAYARAVLTAAVDAARLGVRIPLSPELLRAAAPGYCTPAQQATAPPNWFETALAYATESLHGAAAALTPVGSGMGELAGYTVTDYLLQHTTALRRYERVPVTTWDALLAHVHDLDDLVRLAANAEARLLYGYAVPLYRRVADTGDDRAAWRSAELLAAQGRGGEAIAVLRILADTGDGQAAQRLVELLVEHGRTEEAIAVLRVRADTGDWWATKLLAELGPSEEVIAVLRVRADARDGQAAWQLVELLAELGRAEDLRVLADAGDQRAAQRLVELLVEHGRTEEAVAVLRVRADARDGQAAWQLVELLAELGRAEDLRVLADNGNGWAAERLVELLAELGRAEDLRVLADAGDQRAASRLAGLLAEHGRTEEAIAVLRVLADAGDQRAASRLAGLLAEHGRTEEAIAVLRVRADARDGQAAWQLVELLAELGRAEDAITLLRPLADTGDDWAAWRLEGLLAELGGAEGLRVRADAGDRQAARRLARQGRLGDTIAVLRARADTGNWEAIGQLAELLAGQGRLGDTIAVLRVHADAGDRRAAKRLAGILAEHGRGEEAIALLLPLADTDDWWAAWRLAGLLAEQGRIEDLRARADIGDEQAAQWLARLLAEHGQVYDLHAEVNAGRPGAAGYLISLVEQEQPSHAERLKRFGLNPDGSIANSPLRETEPRE